MPVSANAGMTSLLAAATLPFAFLLSGCDQKAETKTEPARAAASAPVSVTSAASPARVAFERVDARSITARGVPGGTEGRFIARPAVVGVSLWLSPGGERYCGELHHTAGRPRRSGGPRKAHPSCSSSTG